jgi:HEAT repeat protein
MHARRIAVVAVALGVALALAGAGRAAELDAEFRKMLPYAIGDSRDAMRGLEGRIRAADAADYAVVEGQLLGLLESRDATPDCRDWACRQLVTVGSPRSVAPLAEVLADPERAHVARLALQAIGGPEALAALRSALERSRGAARIGIVSSLAFLRDEASVRSIARLARETDEATARAAVKALARIGGTEAARSLEGVTSAALRNDVAEALIAIADPMNSDGREREAARLCRPLARGPYPPAIQVAAASVLSKADPAGAAGVVRRMLGSSDKRFVRGAARILAGLPEGAVREVASGIEELSPDAQIVCLSVLATRTDAAAAVASVVEKLVRSPEARVAAAAIDMLRASGSAASVSLLLELAERPEVASAAADALKRMGGAGLDASLIACAAAAAQPEKRRSAAIAALAERNAADAVPTLLGCIGDASRAVASSAMKALGRLASAEHIEEMTGALARAGSSSARKGLRKATSAVIARMSPRSEAAPALLAQFRPASDAAKEELLPLLALAGSDEAYGAVRGCLRSRSASIRKAAIRALGDWADATPIDDLLRLARTETDTITQVLAFRGYVGMVPMLAGRPVGELVETLKRAMPLAKRADQRRLIIHTISNVPHPETLAAAKSYLGDAELGDAARLAVKEIEEGLELVKKNPLSNLYFQNAVLHGPGIDYETAGNRRCIGNWDGPEAWAHWDVVVLEPGTYEVVAEQAFAGSNGNTFLVEVGGETLEGKVQHTGDWGSFRKVNLGRVRLSRLGRDRVAVRWGKRAYLALFNLRSVSLTRVE